MAGLGLTLYECMFLNLEVGAVSLGLSALSLGLSGWPPLHGVRERRAHRIARPSYLQTLCKFAKLANVGHTVLALLIHTP